MISDGRSISNRSCAKMNITKNEFQSHLPPKEHFKELCLLGILESVMSFFQARNTTLACCVILSVILCCTRSLCLASMDEGGPTSPPSRIVSLGPINTENVYLLGAGDRLIGTTAYCVRPEAARFTEKIGSVMQVSVEKIIGLRPDLVLATGLTRTSQVELLRKVGLKVVCFDQPSSFASSCEQFEQLGRLLGLEAKAQAITHDLQNQIRTITERISILGLPKQKVIMQIGTNPLYISGRDSFTSDFIELILAENGIGDTPSGRVGYERIISVNPDVILIGMMGSETGVAADERKKWQKIKVIKAVQDKRIHVVDPNLVCSPSPATFVQALKVIAPLIYPEMSKINQGAKLKQTEKIAKIVNSKEDHQQ